MPAATTGGERDQFVDEVLIRSMMLDGRLAVKPRQEHPVAAPRDSAQVEQPVVLGSWF